MLTSGLYGKTLSTSFNSAISSAAQKIKPKIVIKWLDSRHLDNLVVTTNDAPANTAYPNMGFFFTPQEAFNGINRQSFTWAVAGAKDINGHTIKADGSWYAMPSITSSDLANTQAGSNLEYGWWSNSVSTANVSGTYSGYEFTTEPYIDATFTTRKINRIRIVTSEFYGQVSSYLLQVFDGSNNSVIAEHGTIPANSYYADHILSSAVTQDVARIRVTIHTTKNPSDRARIQEIIPIYETDISDYVINYSVNRARDVHSTSLPVGGSEIASVDLTLDNTNKVFNIFNNSSTYGKYMVKDLEVEVYTGWRIKKPDADNINSSSLSTQLVSSISNTATSMTVLDRSKISTGGVDNTFLLTIDPNTQSEETVLCSNVSTAGVVTILERGYGNTNPVAHSAAAPVVFDVYEYIPNGTFYVDEWSLGTDMTVKVNLQDWSKFLSERTVNNGFFLQNAYVGDAVENLLMRANFPKANIKKLNNYRQGAKNRSAISSYSFNEESVDRSGNNIISSSGLRARFWGMPTNKKDISVKDILADAIDKELSVFEKALGEKPFVSPSFTTLSKNISTLSTDALRLVDYSFTGTDSTVYSEYFNGVFDGYYIPTDSGNQYIIINIAYGGVRVYLDDVLIINKWKLATSQERHQSALLNLQAGAPRKIRIEFWHSFNNSGAASFRISLYKALQGFGDVLVSASQCCTIVALDSVGSKNTSSVVSSLDSNNHRNNAIYINSPKLNQVGGLTSDISNKAVLLESNAYIRIPYNANTNVVNTSSVNYTGDWSIEIYAKFASGVFSSDGEYISNWNNSASTSGFEFFNNSSSHGFKIKTTANSVVSTETVSSNTALSNSAFSHLIVTYGDGVLSYYVNGSVVESKTLTGTPINWASKDTTIGGRGASYSGGAEVAPTTIRSFIIDEFAVYNKTLSASDVSERYTEAVMQPLTQFAFLYGNENSLSEIMNDITFADMGRMYINELNIANYEHFYRFFEPSINQHSTVQTNLSDSTNIIDGNYVVQLQCNKVVVPVASVQTAGLARQQLWVAPDKSTLAVTKLTANLTANANVVYVTNTIDPVFSDTGYIQIDSEIIKYISKTATSFNGLERGQFQTTAASHLINAKAKETRYYDIKFDKAPAFNVRSPLISAIDFENPDKVSILRYIPGPYGAELILAASESVDVGSVAYLQGDDVFTDIPYTTTIAGTPVVITEQNIQIKEQSSSLVDSIKKYGVKDITIQSNFITDSVHAKKLADFIIDKTQTPVPILNITTTVLPKTQLGDRIRITSLGALDITNTDYWVISYNTSVGDQVTQSLILRKVS